MLDPKTILLDAAHKQQRICSTPLSSNVLQHSEPLGDASPIPQNHNSDSLPCSGALGPVVASSQPDAPVALVLPSKDNPADWSRQGLLRRAEAMFNDDDRDAGLSPVPSGICAVQKTVTNELAVEAMLAV